ncbi:MAG: hypothetical protein ACYC23_16830 [Limisphaerales bacterium]
MKLLTASLAGVCATFLLTSASSQAGTFKRIVIDGSFDDWAGVPVLATDDEDAPESFDFRDVYVANDEEYLYLSATLYAPADYASFNHQVIIDTDQDPGTGHPWAGVGSEFFIENGNGYQQTAGSFNAGETTDLNWAVAPVGSITRFEARLARSAKNADATPVFTQEVIALALQVLDSNWAEKDLVTPADPYEFAPTPPVATGTRTLVELTTTPWNVNDVGIAPGPDWAEPVYDDTQGDWRSGRGLFGFGTGIDVYPAPLQTPLAPDLTTYYFRVPFVWEFDVTGVALVMTNYLSDGAALYLNGVPVRRVRLPDGDLTSQTPATGGPASPGAAEVLSLPVASLVTGNNVLAVEVHQSTGTPADLVFGLSLTATDSLPPFIEDPLLPADRTVIEGESTTFDAGAVQGSPPLSYQWFKDDVAILGATDPTWEIGVVLEADGGRYHVVITNGQGQSTSSRVAELLTTAQVVSLTDPALPADILVLQGRPAQFEVAATGSPLLYYQWFKNEEPIDNAVGPQFTIPSVTFADAGQYSVAVGNRLGSVASREALLTVQADDVHPVITSVSGSARRVIVNFSEPLDPASATAAQNFTLTGGPTVLSAVLDANDPSVVILTTTPQMFGTVYNLTASGVRDVFENPGTSSAPFRSSILIDGDFEDWAGISPIVSIPQETPGTPEFKDFYLANDSDYLYLRFSFHEPVGPLPTDHYYHIYLDSDHNASSGRTAAAIGIEVMIENGAGYQQKNGDFNEGGVDGLDLQLAPESQATEFECRISRQAVYAADGQPVFTADTIAVAMELMSSSWSPIDTAPTDGSLIYMFHSLPPVQPGPLQVSKVNQTVEISWPGAGFLESRPSLSGGSWSTIPNAVSPYVVSPDGAARYYRLRQ